MNFNNFKRFCMIFQILGIISLEKCYVAAQSSQNINVLFINEVGHELAAKAVDVVLTYLEKNPGYGITVQINKIEVNNTDAQKLLENICTRYAESVEENQPPHVVFDTTKSVVASKAVKLFTRALGLPTVTANYGKEGSLWQWLDKEENKQKYLLQVMPPADLIPEVVRSLVEKMNITNAAILYDDTFVMGHKYKSLFCNIPTSYTVTKIVNNGLSGLREQITKLRKLNINNFFILGKLQTIREVLESIESKFFDRNFAWHAITLDEGEIFTQRNNIRMMFLKPMAYPKYRDRLSLLRTTFNLIEEPQILSAFYFDLALRTFLAIKEMLQSGVWPNDMKYLSCEGFEGENTPERVIDLNQYFMQITEPTSYGEFKFSTEPSKPFNGYSYMQFEMNINKFETHRGNSMNKNLIGTWTAGLKQELIIKDEGSIKNLTADTVYRIYTVVQAPFIIKDESATKGFRGYCIDLIEEIAAIVHFDYVIEEVEDGEFGNMDENGDWNGIVKKLIENEADIGLGSMSVMAERETVIDFTVPFYDLVGIAIMLKASNTKDSIFKFMTVLESNVWLFIFVAYWFTVWLLSVFDRWSPNSFRNNREKYKDDDEKRLFTFRECMWFCIFSLSSQGGGAAPKNISGRLIAATWWFYGFIMLSSYTANLAAFLTTSTSDIPVNSLDELADQYKITYAPLNGSAALTFFERMANIEQDFYGVWKNMSVSDSLDPLERSNMAVWDYPVSDKYTKMWQAMQVTGLPATLEEAVERVRNSTTATGFAFLGDATDIRYLVMNNCDLQVVGEEFSRKPYAIAVQQGSHLKDQFNNAIQTLLTNRQLEQLKERWWTNEAVQSTCIKPADQSEGISMHNMGGVFFLIFCGAGMSWLTLLIEYCWYKYYKKALPDDVTGNSVPVESVDENQSNDDPRSGFIKRANSFKPRFGKNKYIEK